MKKFMVFIILLIVCSIIFGQATNYPKERTDPRYIRTNGESRTWIIKSTGDDTSEVINLFANSTIQCVFTDTAGTDGDSIAYKVELLVSTLVYPDSSFRLYQTVETSVTDGNYTTPKKLLTLPGYGKIVVTGLSGNTQADNGLIGYVRITGWSNAEGMSSRLR